MAKKSQAEPILLRWSQHVPASDVQDPLGLGLRGSARLASQLLYCITSITPRARYFSFLPWCVLDYQKREEGKSHAHGLRDAIILREQALTLACLAHHEGEPCLGGRLVGSRQGEKWYAKGEKNANFRKLKNFAKVPALSAYLASLVNLGFFVTDQQLPDTDEETTKPDFTFDDIQLSDLGLNLAQGYESGVGTLSATKLVASRERSCSIRSLAEFGKHGGLCELSKGSAADRDLLRDIFFALVSSKGESHVVRRRSLLLILEICRQLSAEQRIFDEAAFSGVVYFGEIANDEGRLQVHIPAQLADIATRWRMFYFHHYMGVALEGLFSWLVSQLGQRGLAGATIESLAARLDEASVRKNLSELLQVDLKGRFGDTSPAKLFGALGLPEGDLTDDLSRALDGTVRSLGPFAEDNLEDTIRGNEHLHSSTGLAVSMILLATTLARYKRWESTSYGDWLAGVADPGDGHDPYLDLVPPLVVAGMRRRFDNWWKCTWKELATFVVSRYVVQQHQTMSYEKTATGDRCLLQVDGSKVLSTGGYDKIGLGNPRLGSAIQILTDLGLLREDNEGVIHLTTESKRFLKQELAKEVGNEVR